MSAEESPKRKVRADPHRVMVWTDRLMDRRPVQLGLTGALVLALALLLGPRLWARDSLSERIRVGQRAEGNVKATRDFDYMPSAERLDAERAAAVDKVLPVFDHQSDQGTILVSRINRAFSLMSGADAGLDDPDSAEAQPSKAPSPAVVADRPPDRPRVKDPAERHEVFSDALQVEVPDKAFRVLKKAEFSAEVRASLVVVLGPATSQLIVPHRGVLTPYGNRPIVVRHLVGGRLGPGGEEQVSNFNRIKDLGQVRQEIRLQGAFHMAKLPTELSRVVVTLAQGLVAANLAFNRAETEARRAEARQKVRPRPVSVVKGQVIIRDGDPVNREHISMVQAMEAWGTGVNVVQEIVGVSVFVLLLLFALFRYARQQFRRFFSQPRDLLVMGVLLLAFVGLTKGVVSVGGGVARGQDLPIFIYVIPLAAGAMLTRLLVSAEASVLFAVALSSLAGLLVDLNLGMMLFYLITSLVGAGGVGQVQSRSTILRAGLTAGIAGAGLLLGMRLFQGQAAEVGTLYVILGAVAGGVLAAFMTLALLPAIEWLFAYTTDVTLLELANLNHPLLRDLILRAPGTYHHSMVVGSLAETACDSIGANGLLARVASYYHDIGKVKNAEYFAENFRPGDNPHNRLKPSMSALIIRNHAKDTVEMLRERAIPELVIDVATQHHGKTLIEFFYHKAQEQKEEGEEVQTEDYRYPGPKPQSREAGVIMLADGVEAAARSLAECTEDRLRAVVQRVINGKFTDGQLDHCDLSLRDLHLIAKSFLQVLRGLYHQRPTYPWQARRESSKRGDEARRETARLKAGEAEGASRDERLRGEAARAEGKGGKGSEERQDNTARNGKKGKGKGKDVKRNRRDGGSGRKTGDLRAIDPAQEEEEPGREAAAAGAGASGKPAGEGDGAQSAESASAQDAPEESSQDIKRLGLS